MRVVGVKKYSPILDSILFGGSSVAMNLAELSRQSPKEKWLFASWALNHAVIFKYPNFPERLPPKLPDGWSGRPQQPVEEFRPIETGIYLPYDTERPRDGGKALYLRQKNWEALFQEHLGLKSDIERDDLKRDLRLLDLLDTLPSLDPFLVKDCLDANAIAFDADYLRLDPDEVHRIKAAISVKITEIIEKAFAAENRTLADKERMIESLWNPALPEAREFVQAFGISAEEAPFVFTAWKGITFYQVQLRDLAPGVAGMLRWLGSTDAVPLDAAQNRRHMDQLKMYRERITKRLGATADETRTIMKEYEGCHQEFLAGKPRKLVAFLKDARRTYWVLASCISALHSAVSVFSTDVTPRRANRLHYDEENAMFQRLDIVLNRKREAPASF